MKTRKSSEAKTGISAPAPDIRNGQAVILAEAQVKRREPGALAGRIWIAPDFDELPEDMEKTFGIR